LKDRVILSSEIAGTAKGDKPLDKVLKDNGIVAVSFFTNGINTSTQGLDFVAAYRNIELAGGKLTANLAGNYMLENKLLSVNNPSLIAQAGKSIFDKTQEALLLTSRPKYKAILGLDWAKSNFSINLNNTLFGSTRFHQNGLSDGIDTEFTPAVVTDLGASIKLTEKATLSINISNLFNVTPKWDFIDIKSGTRTRYDANNNVPSQKYFNEFNLITFNGRYSNVTYDGSQFSQLGLMGNVGLNVKF
jgi:iron complex outermembrane receptor protein